MAPLADPPLTRTGLRLRPVRAVAVAAVLAWVLAGLAGAYLYVHRYWLYRGFPAPALPASVSAGREVRVSFFSHALQARTSYLAYLPPGYAREAATGRRFGVLYVLHGHPGRAQDILDVGLAGSDLDQLMARHRIRPMILVLPEATTGPEGGGDTEWANTPSGRYEDVVLDIVRSVDARFATHADRAHRVLAGLSSGAYGAVNVGLHHLGTFGNLQSWSGYFVQTHDGVFAHASRTQLAANSPALYVRSLAPRIRRLGLRADLYVGRADKLPRLSQLGPFVARLRADGASVRTAEPRGAHDWRLWRREMPRMLEVADHWFRRPLHARTPGSRG
jgi:enterochelin esterase-like enzyme